MLRIRLRRTGRTNRPHYRIVVAEHTAPLTGKFVDELGHFDPRTKAMGLNEERLTKWLSVGAQPSNRVAKILTSAGVSHKLIVVKQRAARAPKKAVEEPSTPAKPAAAEANAVTDEPSATEPEVPTAPESEPTAEPTATDEPPATE